MAKTTIGSIFGLMTDGELNAQSQVKFVLGGMPVDPAQVKVTKQGYCQNSYVQVAISDEWIDRLAARRMKEMYAAQVDAMFASKGASDGSG